MEYDNTLDGFLKLEANWDSYDALPIDPEVIAAAKSFLKAIRTGMASVCPCPDGGVQIESNIDGYHVEIELSSNPDENSDALWAKGV